MAHTQVQIEHSQLWRLLEATAGRERTAELFAMIAVDAPLLTDAGETVPRVVLAQAMNMLLFAKNLDAVPEGKVYVTEKLAVGGQVVFDHGALRTVAAANTGALPTGELAFKRFLEPLGFTVADVYPLARLKMTGRAYCHQDAPELVAQFFVSELHVDQFSPAFQQAVDNVVKSSRDPLNDRAKALLVKLADARALPFAEAVELLPQLVGCFAVQHDTPALADYEALLAESAEMAWISTEGNCFNHATDHVDDVFAVADALRAQGMPIKDKVEVSANGSVRQTAFKATQVERQFKAADGSLVTRTVPGSFYEFITRDLIADSATGEQKLDLRFDSSNAQGIFKMTAAAC
ncbi:DUF1338 domain-containing protein [Crenobacter sp. SG2303]|uniref:2-oxoadipate dioxygenase/decarboxylase n=1 Tax=Crenobacter oryzisoli TaxID=3056844 RepID=A0ABT7XI30_9NEIS|nr:DUF1338 domain-containing protein [Crenobacter sp. SG2303]MDN0073440.1 DUF1338 domain-containing protein [Crenobacter sp. SG2303]